jgi:HTH-type transcriptional regulator/antitoxin HigA
MKLQVIKNAVEHERALAEVERLINLDPEEGTDDAEMLAVLAVLVENYERDRFPIAAPTAVEAIRFRMEQEGLTQRDLEPYIGSRSKVSEVLKGKTPLSVRMMRALHSGLGIPAQSLLGEPMKETDGADVDWARFPVREMWKRGWIEATASEVRKAPGALAARFFADSGGAAFAEARFRQTLHHRTGQAPDPYAILAWCARVQARSCQMDVAPFKGASINVDFLGCVARLSAEPDGPKRALAMLAQHGVPVIVEPHLPRTRLDGAAMSTTSGHPAIGLTLRHDRVDSFWFTLLHELAHVALHLSRELVFVDDLDTGDGDDILEKEADKFARDAIIPRGIWRRSAAFRQRTPETVKQLASELHIHPALVAGRLRRETGNFYLFSQLLGHGTVRPIFGLQEGES